MSSRESFHQYQKIKEFFYTAIALPPDERDRFIDEIDADLRAEIRSLLEVWEDSQEFLEDFTALDAVQDSGFTSGAEKFVGRMIDKYKILGELGQGGMGIVFLAEREDFHQQVALKLIKSGIDSEKIFRRFIKEREILATLEHPNIARLIDGGITDDGMPYLVMEYVPGVSLDQYCRQENLSLETRLELFRKICASVAHAHRNLVMHRDLKPSNILINTDGEPKLLDFGIARLFSAATSTEETVTHFHALTPEYASPEQLCGEKLTTATDVYSLGIILYELVTGKRPFEVEGKSLAEVLKLVCETDPPRPSSIIGPAKSGSVHRPDQKFVIRNAKALRGDLDNIILKSLSKEPNRRYLSVEQFSEDVRRYLTGLPVMAHTDSFAYRTRKYVQRNRGLAFAILIIVIALSTGIIATLQESRRAEKQRLRAEKRFDEVRQLANALITEFPPEIDKSATKAKELLVRNSLKYLDSLAEDAGGDIGLQRELATAYEKIGNLQGNEYFSNLGDTQGALASYRKSLEIREDIFQKDKENSEIRREMAQSYERIGDMLWTMDELPRAFDNYSRSLKFFEEAYAAETGSRAVNSSLATIYWKIGDLLGNDGFANLGDTKGSLEYHRRALEIRERLVQTEPENVIFLDELLSSYTNIAKVLDTTGISTEAEEYYRRSVRLAQKLAQENPGNPTYQTGLSLAYLYLGNIMAENEEYDEAIKNHIQSLKMAEKIAAADKQDAQAERNIAVGRRELGKIYERKGDFKQALTHYRAALAIAQKQAAADPTNNSLQSSLSLNYTKIGDAQRKLNNFSEALINYETSLKIRKKLVDAAPANSKDRAELANVYQGIGGVALQRNDPPDALKYLSQAVEIREKIAIEDQSNLPNQRKLAELYEQTAAIYRQIGLKKNSTAHSAKQELSLALELYERSYDTLKRMRELKALRPSEANHPDELAKEISRCKTALAALILVKR